MGKIGYARVSTQDQDAQMQLDALLAAGCERIFVDTESGTVKDRPELMAALDHLRAGDCLTIWKLDRLGRSTLHLLELSEQLQERGIQLASLTEQIDTSTPMGRMFYTVTAALGEVERERIHERTMAGLESARRAGRVGGRPSKQTPEKLALIRRRLAAGETAGAVAASVGVSRATLYRWLENP